jgi:hypothetical protein
MHDEAPCRGGDPGGEVDQLARDGAPSGLAQRGVCEGRGGPGEVERDHCEGQPGRVGGEPSAGQVREGRILQVGVDVFDDGVTTVGCPRPPCRGCWW